MLLKSLKTTTTNEKCCCCLKKEEPTAERLKSQKS
jgi:hypothetical protein